MMRKLLPIVLVMALSAAPASADVLGIGHATKKVVHVVAAPVKKVVKTVGEVAAVALGIGLVVLVCSQGACGT